MTVAARPHGRRAADVARARRDRRPSEPATHAVSPTSSRPPSALAELDPESLPMPRARGRALVGPVPGAGRRATYASTAAPTATPYARGPARACPGIGPWTADYIALRALGDPDVFLPTDIGIRDAAAPARARPRRGRAPRGRHGGPGAPTP